MTKKIFINLPINDRESSEKFFKALGLQINEKLTDERALCFNLDDNIVIGLQLAVHFKDIINGNDVAGPNTKEVLLSVGLESKAAVDELVEKATAAGAKEMHEPIETPEVYGRTFADLDAHQWNIFFMRSA